MAKNNLLGRIRTESRRRKLAESFLESAQVAVRQSAYHEVGDNQEMVQMMFACCDPALPLESQIAFTLKVISGFSTKQIADRLFISEANVYKRVSRARQQLARLPKPRVDLAMRLSEARLDGVLTTLYLLFAEGHLSTHPKEALRFELCDEAVHLTEILCNHRSGKTPQSCALLSLMYFHLARMNARRDHGGDLLLLEEQDRKLWDQEMIAKGLSWLEQSAFGGSMSRYHAEAKISAEHCLAPSFAETRWEEIISCYDQLEEITGSPLHRMNKALAVAELNGPEAALDLVKAMRPPSTVVSL